MGGGGGMRSKRLHPCAPLAQVNSQSESTQLGATYRESRGCFTFTKVAEVSGLWRLGRLRHLHGEAQRLTSQRQPLNGSTLRVGDTISDIHVIFKQSWIKKQGNLDWNFKKRPSSRFVVVPHDTASGKKFQKTETQKVASHERSSLLIYLLSLEGRIWF